MLFQLVKPDMVKLSAEALRTGIIDSLEVLRFLIDAGAVQAAFRMDGDKRVDYSLAELKTAMLSKDIEVR